MNQNTDLIHQAFAIFLFCIAVTILLVTYRGYITTLRHAKEYQKEEIMYEQYNERKEITVTKGEIITMLLNQNEYDVQIDSYLISKSENVKENLTSYPFSHEKYKKSYAYDSRGNVTRIIYIGL